MTIGKKLKKSLGGPGGMERHSIDYRASGSREFNRGNDDRSADRRIARRLSHPRIVRGGVYLHGYQVHDEILQAGGTQSLPEKDREFLEGVDDQRQAHAEVGRRWMGSDVQTQWLSDIHRRLSA